jgi:hypothetical protein
LRHGWKRFWRRGSAVLGAGAMLALALAGAEGQEGASALRHNELTLAGLRPGRDRISSPKNSFRTLMLSPSRADTIEWKNGCGQRLRVERDERDIVQTVTASALGDKSDDCKTQASAQTDEALETGRRLELNNLCAKVTELYGEPESRSPSVQGSRKLELLFYSFDWSGENVPQSMEVSCDAATGRVVEITLASSTL